MANNSVSQYSIKLTAGGKDLSKQMDGLRILISKDRPLQIISIDINLSREQYNTYLVPYKDNLKLEISSSKGIKSDDEPPDVDATFSYDLCMLEEDGEQSQQAGADGGSSSGKITLTCVSKDQFKNHQKFIKNKIFLYKTRKEMIDIIMSGAKYELQSTIYKESEVIKQTVLPPLRQSAAIKHLDYYVNLFEGALPTYINYCIDGKIYIGSCITNNMKPLKIFYASDNDALSKASNIASKKSSAYDYLIVQAIQESKAYATICAALGKTQTYQFSPMNKLVSKLEMKLNEFSQKIGLSTAFGDDPKIGEHIKKINTKETWFKTHNGLSNVENEKDNLMFAENYVSQVANQAITLSMKVDGAIKFKDFIMVGRKINLTAQLNAIKYNGDYFLDAAELSFSSAGPYWTGHARISAKSSIKLSNT